MAESLVSADTMTDGELIALAAWRQGDFTLDSVDFPVILGVSEGELDLDLIQVDGWVVVSQTCDIVNFGPNREYVSICPIVVAGERFLKDVQNGVTPAAAALEKRVQSDHVVDLTRTASLHKRVLLSLSRTEGFSGDLSRSVFSQSLERRFGRFAFPDWLSNGPLNQIRSRSREKHKSGGEVGKIYQAVDEIRVHGNPDLDSHGAAIGFYVVCDREKMEALPPGTIIKEFATLAEKFEWPDAYVREDEFFLVTTLDDLTGRQLKESFAVDLDFISGAKNNGQK